MINGGSQQSSHFSAFTNDETHRTTPPIDLLDGDFTEKKNL